MSPQAHISNEPGLKEESYNENYKFLVKYEPNNKTIHYEGDSALLLKQIPCPPFKRKVSNPTCRLMEALVIALTLIKKKKSSVNHQLTRMSHHTFQGMNG